MTFLKEYVWRLSSVLRLKRTQARAQAAARAGQTSLAFGPSSLNLMMADVCNSQCIMCGHDYKACGTGDMLTLEKMKTIYGHLNLRETVDVIYGGGGEPFMNPELADIAEYTHRLDPVIQHTVITNLIRADDTTYRRLLKSRVHFLCSINAATAPTFNTITGTQKFDDVMDHLRTLVRLRRELRAHVDISISMILMRKNIDELCDFIRLAAREGVNGVKTLYVRVYPESYRGRDNRNASISPDDSLVNDQAHSDAVLCEAEGLAAQAGVGFDHEPLFGRSVSTPRSCFEAWKSLFINFNGDAYPCPASEILFMRKINSRQYTSGNILKQPVMEFWNNEFWQAIRRTNAGCDPRDIVPECLCCGNSICWWGSAARSAHILDWTSAEKSDVRL